MPNWLSAGTVAANMTEIHHVAMEATPPSPPEVEQDAHVAFAEGSRSQEGQNNEGEAMEILQQSVQSGKLTSRRLV